METLRKDIVAALNLEPTSAKKSPSKKGTKTKNEKSEEKTKTLVKKDQSEKQVETEKSDESEKSETDNSSSTENDKIIDLPDPPPPTNSELNDRCNILSDTLLLINKRLDEKDARIDGLEQRIEEKEVTINDLQLQMEDKDSIIQCLRLIASQSLAQREQKINSLNLDKLVLYSSKDESGFEATLKSTLKRNKIDVNSIKSVKMIGESKKRNAYQVEIKSQAVKNKIIQCGSDAKTGLLATARFWSTKLTRIHKMVLGHLGEVLTDESKNHTACVPRNSTSAKIFIQLGEEAKRVQLSYHEAIQLYGQKIDKTVIRKAYKLLGDDKKQSFKETLLFLKDTDNEE